LNDLLSGRRKGLVASLLRGLLWPWQFPYHLAVSYRNRRFDRHAGASHQVDVPVVSVGNVTVGGTGKTPLVAWVARWFREQGVRVALVSRGYGADPGAVNDEALELEQRLPDVPHLQDPDRVKAARTAIEELDSELLVMDDGFQHRRLRRDLDIVLIDATQPFGYGHVLPRGKLRESLAGLRRADLLVVTRGSAVSEERLDKIRDVLRRYTMAPIAVVDQQPQALLSSTGSEESIEEMKGKPVIAFCGIGNPDGFRFTLGQCGYELIELREFPDHHRYSRDDVQSLVEWTADQHGKHRVAAVVCTHKDLVKVQLERLGPLPLFAQAIGVRFLQGEAEFENKLQEVLSLIQDG